MTWNIFGKKQPPVQKHVLDAIRHFDEKDQKSMVHVRLDKDTAMLLKQLKLATGIEIQQVIAFSVSELIRQHPEIKTIIKQFLTQLNE
jgi:hypothetical protein